MEMKTAAKIIVRGISAPVLLLAGVFLAAGRLSYWQGWAYGASLLLLLLVNLLLLRHKLDLMEERLSPGKGTKWWDKVYFSITTPLYFITLALSIVFLACCIFKSAWVVGVVVLVHLVFASTFFVLGLVKNSIKS